MADRTLARHVTVAGVTYVTGTAESDMADGHADLITNPRAWHTDDDADVPAAPAAKSNYVAVENPLPRAVKPPTADDTPAKATPGKATRPARN